MQRQTLETIKKNQVSSSQPTTVFVPTTLSDGIVQWANVLIEEQSNVEQIFVFKMSGQIQRNASRTYNLTYQLTDYPYTLSFDGPVQGVLNVNKGTTFNAAKYVSYVYDDGTKTVSFTISLPCSVNVRTSSWMFTEFYLYNYVEPFSATIPIQNYATSEPSTDCTEQLAVQFQYTYYENASAILSVSKCDKSVQDLTVVIGGTPPKGFFLTIALNFPDQNKPNNTLRIVTNGITTTLSDLPFGYTTGPFYNPNSYLFRWVENEWVVSDGTNFVLGDLTQEIDTWCVSNYDRNYSLGLQEAAYLFLQTLCERSDPTVLTVYATSIPDQQKLGISTGLVNNLSNITLRIQTNDGSFTDFFYPLFSDFSNCYQYTEDTWTLCPPIIST